MVPVRASGREIMCERHAAPGNAPARRFNGRLSVAIASEPGPEHAVKSAANVT